MAVKTAFDNEGYIREQTAEILGRAETFHNKLYLEFGESFSMITMLPGCCRGMTRM